MMWNVIIVMNVDGQKEKMTYGLENVFVNVVWLERYKVIIRIVTSLRFRGGEIMGNNATTGDAIVTVISYQEDIVEGECL